ncbi:MAG: hypothetical protein J6J35_01275 [Alphaproteobacteria bacterium]|nr:hypothetical protein [Alphaproteobacteria bacterium]
MNKAIFWSLSAVGVAAVCVLRYIYKKRHEPIDFYEWWEAHRQDAPVDEEWEKQLAAIAKSAEEDISPLYDGTWNFKH